MPYSEPVGILSTWETICGIADFTANFQAGLAEIGVPSLVVPIDREQHRFLARRELAEEFDSLGSRLAEHHVVHVQHEFGFFLGEYGMADSLENFHRVIRAVGAKKRRLVVTFHTKPPFKGSRDGALSFAQEAALRVAWRTKVVRSLKSTGATVVAHTRFLRRHLIDLGIPESQIVVVPHGSPPLSPDLDRDAIRQQLGFSPDDKLVAIAGFVSAYKGHLTAVAALRHLPAEYKLLVAGGPHPFGADDTFDRVLSLRQKAKLRDRIHVTGYLARVDLQRHLAAADVMVAPYIERELASSGAIGWALASRRPVVASRIPAFAELNSDGEMVALATPKAPGELARRVLELIQDPERASRLVSRAQGHIESTQWRDIAAAHARLYEN